MSERSGAVSFLLAAILVVAIAGVYFIIDNIDLLRRAQERTSAALEGNSAELRKLRELLKSSPEGTPSQASVPAVSGKTSAAAPAGKINFHNANLEDPDAVDGGRRITCTMSFSGNLNNVINNEAGVSDLWELCNDSLGARNLKDPTKLEPRLAESWTVSPDGKTITVKLRPNIFWHDFTDPISGKKHQRVPVTASDFKFYIDTINNPGLPCDAIRNYFKDLDRVEVIDDLNFKVIWKETYFLSLEFTLGLSPLPRQLYRPDEVSDAQFAEDMLKGKAARNQVIVGCGQYILESYDASDRAVLRRNPDYYAPIHPRIDRREVRLIKDTEKQLIEFKKGELDALGLNATQWTRQTGAPEFLTVCDKVEGGYEASFKNDQSKKAAFLSGKDYLSHKWEKYLYRSFNYAIIAWNMRNPILADKQVRLALTHCIDRPRIINEVCFGLASEISGSFVPHSPYYDQSIKPWPFDIEKAKQLLAAAGWSDTDGDGILDKEINGKRMPFEFTFMMVQNHPYQSKWVPVVQQDMQKAGIKMNVKQAEWSVYTEQMGQFSFDAVSFGWRGGIESDPYQLFHSSQADIKESSNVCGFKNAEADKIIEEGRRTVDFEKRVALYRRFHRIMHEEQPYTFLYCPYSMEAHDKKYVNSIVYPLGMDSTLQWVPQKMQQ